MASELDTFLDRVTKATVLSIEFKEKHPDEADEVLAFVGLHGEFLEKMMDAGLSRTAAQYIGQLASLGGMMVSLKTLKEICDGQGKEE